MRYFVEVAGRTFELELGESGAIRLDGREVEAELRAIAGTRLQHLLVDGRSIPLAISAEEGRGEWSIEVGGHLLDVSVVDERTRAIRELAGVAGGPKGPGPIRAPMPGMVVRVEVEVGQRVDAGDGVVIIEAMKMENELKAESAGVVESVAVSAGQPVEKGAVLVEFAPEEE